MSTAPLFTVKVDCLACEQKFQTSRVRPSFKRPIRRDADFCLHFKEPELNPDFYVVRVCPYCGFAYTENFEKKLVMKHKNRVAEKISSNWTYKDYGTSRSLNDAMTVYKLALYCGQLTEQKPRVIAGLLHHIAWLYRYQQDEEQEKRFLEYALNEYVKVYETETNAVNNARLLFLIGELNRRLKRYHEAVRFFTRVINDKSITDSGMIALCREQWLVTRQDMEAEKIEPPEEEPV